MIEIRISTEKIARLSQALEAVGTRKGQQGLRRALSHTGNKANTAMRRALASQTGLPAGTMRRALRAAMEGEAFVIRSEGGNIRLRFFKPRETRKGVSAAPWNARRVFPATFMRAGRHPNRVPITKALTGGGVYVRKGVSKWPVQEARSGLFIPDEMVRSQSAAAFERTVQDLPDRLLHDLMRLLPQG